MDESRNEFDVSIKIVVLAFDKPNSIVCLLKSLEKALKCISAQQRFELLISIDGGGNIDTHLIQRLCKDLDNISSFELQHHHSNLGLLGHYSISTV